MKVFEQVVEGQRELAQRVAIEIQARGGVVRLGEYPMEYTDLHDLTVDYIIGQAVKYQRRDLKTIDHWIDALRLSPGALALAEEACGLAKGHLEALEELTAQPAQA